MAKVEVISSCFVGARSDIASSISRLDLITWDLRLLPCFYIQKGLIFHKPQEIADNLIDGLKSSLSRTLEWFPPLAGRLRSSAADGELSRLFVDCNNAVAEFRHAVAADVSVPDILEAKYTPQVVYSLFPRNGGVYNIDGMSAPLLAVQVTELADGPFLAFSANHCVVDGTSFWHFINSWAQISRGSDTTISKPPVFERRSDLPSLVHIPTAKQNLVPPPSPIAAQRVFRFRKESIGKLKAKANSEAGTHKISSLQAVLAHLWRSIVRCRWQSTSAAQEKVTRMLIAVGCKTEDGADIAGELLWKRSLYCYGGYWGGELLGEKGLGYTALKINNVISQQTNETLTRDAKTKVEFGAKNRPGRSPLFIGCSPRDDVYGNNFGWGKPVGVRSREIHQ